MSASSHDHEQHVSLCEALDRLLHKGAVLKGEITISVANVDLVYLGFHILLASVETARGLVGPASVTAIPPHNE
jgi:hypothetical protein